MFIPFLMNCTNFTAQVYLNLKSEQCLFYQYQQNKSDFLGYLWYPGFLRIMRNYFLQFRGAHACSQITVEWTSVKILVKMIFISFHYLLVLKNKLELYGPPVDATSILQ